MSPDDAASPALVRGNGLVHVGEQLDDVDGLELAFEREVAGPGAAGAVRSATGPDGTRRA